MKIEINEDDIRLLEYFRRFTESDTKNVAANLMRYEAINEFVNKILKKAEEEDPDIFKYVPKL